MCTCNNEYNCTSNTCVHVITNITCLHVITDIIHVEYNLCTCNNKYNVMCT